MKKILKNIGLLALTLIAYTSCSEDDNTGDSIIKYSPVTVTLSTLSVNTIDESLIDSDDSSTYQILVQATIEEPQPVAAVIDLIKTGGTADSADFEAHKITIPAGQTSASGTVDILKTGNAEGDETLTIGASTTNANYNLSAFTHNLVIENDYINDVLDLTLSWDGEFENGDVTLTSICDVDYDLLLADSSGAILGYIAGTSACPEEGSLSGLADGTYFLLADLYDNPLSGLGFTDAIPLTLTYNQEYFETSGTIVNTTQNLSLPGATDFSYLIGVATLEVTGGYNYTVTPL